MPRIWTIRANYFFLKCEANIYRRYYTINCMLYYNGRHHELVDRSNINFLYVNDFVSFKVNVHPLSITDITFTGLDCFYREPGK